MSTKVEDVMIRNVKTVNLENTVLDAADMMNRFDIGCVIVTENGRPVGVVTERDLLKKVISKRRDPAGTRLYEVMSAPLITVKPHAAITSAAKIMIKARIKKLPVAEADHLMGILSLTDLMPLLKKNHTANRISVKNAPERIKRIFDACIDPETNLRKKCPLIVLGDMPIGCLGAKCMWYDDAGCVFKSFTRMLLDKKLR
jgi:CBS domain-containing protein